MCWQTAAHTLLGLAVRACVCVWGALTDSVWVCDRGCQHGVREMCLVSHSADLISGRTVHSGPAVAPYITPRCHSRAGLEGSTSQCARKHSHTLTHIPAVTQWRALNVYASTRLHVCQTKISLTITFPRLFLLSCPLIYTATQSTTNYYCNTLRYIWKYSNEESNPRLASVLHNTYTTCATFIKSLTLPWTLTFAPC